MLAWSGSKRGTLMWKGLGKLEAKLSLFRCGQSWTIAINTLVWCIFWDGDCSKLLTGFHESFSEFSESFLHSIKFYWHCLWASFCKLLYDLNEALDSLSNGEVSEENCTKWKIYSLYNRYSSLFSLSFGLQTVHITRLCFFYAHPCGLGLCFRRLALSVRCLAAMNSAGHLFGVFVDVWSAASHSLCSTTGDFRQDRYVASRFVLVYDKTNDINSWLIHYKYKAVKHLARVIKMT